MYDFLLNLNQRLQPSKKQRRQPINLMELSVVNFKIQIIMEILDCFKDTHTYEYETEIPSVIQLEIILTGLMSNEEHLSDQEKEDLELEIKRLERIIEFEKIENSNQFKHHFDKSDVKNLHHNIREVLLRRSKYSVFLNEAVKNNLKELNKKIAGGLAISDRERIEIVSALQQVDGIKKGAWFKCPNGHYYVIDQCGGAMEKSKCIECNATIGGEQHRLVDDSKFAPEMDGAAEPAWPGVHY